MSVTTSSIQFAHDLVNKHVEGVTTSALHGICSFLARALAVDKKYEKEKTETCHLNLKFTSKSHVQVKATSDRSDWEGEGTRREGVWGRGGT